MTDILKIKTNEGWKGIAVVQGDEVQIQSDWAQTSSLEKDYIKNKPTKLSDFTDDTALNPVDKADTLNGLIASVEELNYCDGVSSNIQTQINNKANIDLLNISEAGLSKCAGLSMPSEVYEDLTLGASGSTYTAPANGWFLISKGANGSSQYVLFANTLSDFRLSRVSSGTHGIDMFFPVLKDDVVKVTYTLQGTTEKFRFYYAVGSESEAE